MHYVQMQPVVPFDFQKRAREAMQEEGFVTEFPIAVVAELQNHQTKIEADADCIRDLCHLLWSSIDNAESKDLDQVEFAETLADGSIRALVGIADVDVHVPRDSATDKFARQNSTSVYTGCAPFPMLPSELSTDRSSLVADATRLALVAEFVIAEDGTILSSTVYRGLLKNAAKLNYDEVGCWLEGKTPTPQKITSVPRLVEQLQLQKKASDRLMKFRERNGALTLGGVETTPVIRDNEVQRFVVTQYNPARKIIESFMVAANVTMAGFLRSKHALCIRRVVRTPKRWDRIREVAAQYQQILPEQPDSKALNEFLFCQRQTNREHYPDLSLTIVKLLGPGEYIVETPGQEHEGHFGLAVNDYTHSTAPNRRYADLITQRLLKNVLCGATTTYTEAELAEIAAHCSERESAARKVERLMRKIAAAVMLRSHLGEAFDSIVTGVTAKGTFARLTKYPAEGRIIRNERGLDVGDKVSVRLLSVDLQKGFIDFEAVR